MMLDREQLSHQLRLLLTHRRTVSHLTEQAAQYGGETFAPTQVMQGLYEARSAIRESKAILRAHGIAIEDAPNDEARPVILTPIIRVESTGDKVSLGRPNEAAGGPTTSGRERHAGIWTRSPFPGLRSFTPGDARIFFGRSAETDDIVRRVGKQRFVAVVGASGSGKSSLVGAGLIPRLQEQVAEGSKDWLLPDWNNGLNQWIGLYFTPGEVNENPFIALALKIAPLVDDVPRKLAKQLDFISIKPSVSRA